MAEVPRITLRKLKWMLDRGEPVTLLDTRTDESWGGSDVMLPGAKRIRLDDLEDRLAEVPKTGTIVAYCT
jgi:rhodanese-related sulfurtransferase